MTAHRSRHDPGVDGTTFESACTPIAGAIVLVLVLTVLLLLWTPAAAATDDSELPPPSPQLLAARSGAPTDQPAVSDAASSVPTTGSRTCLVNTPELPTGTTTEPHEAGCP